MQIPYTGSDVLGSALSMDKIRTKQVWLSLGLPTPRYVRLNVGDDVHAAAQELGLPVIIKPSCEGSSVGVSRVFNDADLDAAVELAARYPGEMLMEQLIEGGDTRSACWTEKRSRVSYRAGRRVLRLPLEIFRRNPIICPGLPEAEEKKCKSWPKKLAGVGCRRGRGRFMRDKNGGIFLRKPIRAGHDQPVADAEVRERIRYRF